MQVDRTDIGASDQYLVWLELGSVVLVIRTDDHPVTCMQPSL